MKKISAIVLAVIIAATLLTATTFAEGKTCYVTVSNGDISLCRAEVPLEDCDGDGAVSINDALYKAHELYFDGGATAGYLSEATDWGMSLYKLWGAENGGSYGYYVNNGATYSLLDGISEGDSVYAYVYTDTMTYSDTYSFFDAETYSLSVGEKKPVTLSYYSYDENWNLVKSPLSGAEITVDGEKTGIITDENGKAEISLTKAGDSIISAVSDSMTLVPPVAVATVASNPKTSDAGLYGAVALLAVAAFLIIRKK